MSLPARPLRDFKIVLFSFSTFSLAFVTVLAFLMSPAYYDTAWLPFKEEPASAVKRCQQAAFSRDGPRQDCLTWRAALTKDTHWGTALGDSWSRQDKALPFRAQWRPAGTDSIHSALSWARLRLLSPHHRRTSPSAQCCFLPAFHKSPWSLLQSIPGANFIPESASWRTHLQPCGLFQCD